MKRRLITNTLILGMLAYGVASIAAPHASKVTPSNAIRHSCAILKDLAFAGETVVSKTRIVEASASAPEYCVVEVTFNDSTLRFEAWLPTKDWNGKLAVIGGGGWDGWILPLTYLALKNPTLFKEHYALVASNGGNDSTPPFDPTHKAKDPSSYFRAEFAYNADQLAEFSYLSVHRMLLRSKDVLGAFYEKAPALSYFEGCSTGGREAMMEAQRYPSDFNGIVAASPAGNIIGLHTQFNRIATAIRTPGGSLSPAKRTLLARAVLAQCDELDGLKDGIISNPKACHFNPAVLRCSGGVDNGDTCLSDAQINTVKIVTEPYSTNNNKVFHSGYNFGGEDIDKGWGDYIWPQPGSDSSLQGTFSDGFVRSMITRNPAFDPTKFDANDWLASLDLVGSMMQAFDPDLSAMVAKGGKLVMWNGAIDTSVSAKDSALYYDRVVQTIGQLKTESAVELFVLPGVGHCGGGPGADQVDWFKAMSLWVEQGIPPSKQGLALSKLNDLGATVLQRPACKYPTHNTWELEILIKRKASTVRFLAPRIETSFKQLQSKLSLRHRRNASPLMRGQPARWARCTPLSEMIHASQVLLNSRESDADGTSRQ
jgi:hypothetical protein